MYLDESEIQQANEMQILKHKTAKLKWLRIESQLVELDAKIKGCLGLDRAEPKAALDYMVEMLKLQLDPLMLKKHPHVVDMVKRVRRYIGNVKAWNLTEDGVEGFAADAEKIREKADEVFDKFLVKGRVL